MGRQRRSCRRQRRHPHRQPERGEICLIVQSRGPDEPALTEFASPRRCHSPVDPLNESNRSGCRGYTNVVDADLSKFFDAIPRVFARFGCLGDMNLAATLDKVERRGEALGLSARATFVSAGKPDSSRHPTSGAIGHDAGVISTTLEALARVRESRRQQ
jgi:hypothetical protein